MADYEYIDEETGEVISPDKLDAYEPVSQPKPEPPVELPSWFDTITDSVDSGANRFVENLYGGVNYLEDKIGTGTNFGEYMSDALKDYEEPLRQDLAKIPRGSAKSIVSGGVEGLTNIGLNLPFGGGPLRQAGIYGLEAFGGKYGDMRDQGVPKNDAENAAIVSGAVNTATSLPMLGPAMKAGAPFIRRALGAGAGGAIGGYLGTLGDIYSNYVGTGDAPEFSEAMEQANQGAKVGAVTGAGLAAIAGKNPNRVADIDNIAAKMDEVTAQAEMPVPAQEQLALPEPQKMLPAPEGITYGDNFTAKNPTLSQDTPVGDLPSVAQQEQGLKIPERVSEIIPEGQPRDFTPQESAKPVIDKAAAEALFNANAATKLGDTTAFPDMDAAAKLDAWKPPPVTEVSPASLKLSVDVPNFKRGANSKGIVDPLPGKFDKKGLGPIAVWERENGDREVISGRHRWNKALTENEPTMPVQIYKESDGFSREMAHILDAEQNIKDGKGQAADFAQYFKFRRATEESAKERGLLRSPQARTALNITTKGSDDVYQLHQRGELTDAEAEAIATAAPGEADYQRVGIRAVKEKNVTSDKVRGVMGLAKRLQDDGQTNLFGEREFDGVIAVRNEAAKQARKLETEIQLLSRSGNRPELLEKYGEKVKKPAELKRIGDKLKHEKYLLDNVELYPEIADKIADKIGVQLFKRAEPVLEDPNPPAVPNENQSDLFAPPKPTPDVKMSVESDFGKAPEAPKVAPKANIKSQKGAVLNPFKFDLDGVTDFIKGKGNKIPVKKAPDIYNYFNGNFKKRFAHQSSIAKKFPEFKPFYDEGVKLFENKNAKAYELKDTLTDYETLAADSKKKVNDHLIAARLKGKDFIASPENLQKLGLNPDEIQAYQSVRNWADKALDMLKAEEAAHLTYQGKIEEANGLDAKYENLKQSNYVPFNRWGKYGLKVVDKDGNVVDYRMSDSTRELRALGAEAIKAGNQVKIEKVLQPVLAEHAGISPEILATVNDTTADIPLNGFKKHMAESKNLAGFDLDLERSINEYSGSLSNYLATREFRRATDTALKSLPDDVKYSPLKKYAKEHQDFLITRSKDLGGMHQLFSMYYLAGNIKTAAINATQPLTTTYPLLAKYTSGLKLAPERLMIKAAKKTGEYALSSKEKFLARNPDLAIAINEADKKGVLSASVFQEMTGRAYNPSKTKKGLRDAIYTFNDLTERSNRIHSFIAGWEAYPDAVKGYYGKDKGPPPTRQKFAEDFTRETQFDYSKADRPEISRKGLGKYAYIFRLWPSNYLKILKNSAVEGQAGVATRAIGSMAALGGLTAVPLLGQLLKNAEAAGYDIKGAVRDVVENAIEDDTFYINSMQDYIPYWNKYNKKQRADNLADMGLYGPTALATGVSPGGALNVGDLAPNIEDGLLPGLTRTIMGIAPDPLQRIGKAAWLAGEMDSPSRAIEALMPEAIRNLMVAGRWATEGVRDPKGREIMKDPTTSEIVKKGLGFTPTRLATAYEEGNSIKMLGDRARDNDNINFKIAKALNEGNSDKVQQLIRDAMEKNKGAAPEEVQMPDEDAIASYLLGMKDSKVAAIKELPDKAKPKGLEIQERFKR